MHDNKSFNLVPHTAKELAKSTNTRLLKRKDAPNLYFFKHPKQEETLSKLEYEKIILVLRALSLQVSNLFHTNGYLALDLIHVTDDQPLNYQSNTKAIDCGTIKFVRLKNGTWSYRYHGQYIIGKTPFDALTKAIKQK